ncbi:hypothetical protein Tco_0577930 [Tanacetum coccineum]
MKSFRGSNTDDYNPFVSRNYHEGRECELDYLGASRITGPFTNGRCFSFVRNPSKHIFPRHLQEFYAHYKFNRDVFSLNFKMYGHNYKWSLEKLGTVLNISSQGRLFYSDETHTNVFTKYNRYHPQDANYINASLIQNTILKSHDRCETPLQHNRDVFELKEKFKLWENVLTTNVFVKIRSRAIAKNNFKGNALDPWILALEQGEQQTREREEGKQSLELTSLMIGGCKKYEGKEQIAYWEYKLYIDSLCDDNVQKLHQLQGQDQDENFIKAVSYLLNFVIYLLF